jgi:hypothetical protein
VSARTTQALVDIGRRAGHDMRPLIMPGMPIAMVQLECSCRRWLILETVESLASYLLDLSKLPACCLAPSAP